ncbi:UDP-3-O-(3-hydroxymyristoyl)glucosamine N-acyltransferase [Neorhizobium sp. P12A]|jgi:UDP-3-O-[3-hydroxymyristoyl] glucosamine N-acyltransferase|uniref:UDP-3-O-(3-hydroxymyristoyl)glucosamine N-acyltransferase n=1 Tax=Neorhizobium sp. P12A TaxID=2268027 RepID=UPI0011EE9BDB|nr:UDP-3-O-(3-hydroxymyristoyl)glucosamine N-acyltransferase [Neorhizobium sp. P12A]KAA0694436.1 UDP-3-O-(3-hydroxymyristoyl)glucosamine N-acyltransferase [Neorhizobium sp. P12A]
MEHNCFFPPHDGVSLRKLAEYLGAELADEAHADVVIRSVAPVHRATDGDLCYILSRKSSKDIESCRASALICEPSLRSIVPDHIPVILASKPHTAFAMAGLLLHPEAARPDAVTSQSEAISPAAFVDPAAKLEANVTVEPMAVIGRGAEIGEGTSIRAGAVIGANVKIGRNCTIGAGATVLCALIGNNVIIHNGARIGQDGFGYAPGPRGMVKIVQIGRVIIQDYVEVGANSTIDRGAMDDTVIGEGTKIDNQVQIGHNVRIGRHCAIVSQVGIAGSTKIGNGVQIGGQAGLNGHITIGDGVQIGAKSGVISDIPPGERYAGIPARPLWDFLRESAEVAKRTGSRNKERGVKKND